MARHSYTRPLRRRPGLCALPLSSGPGVSRVRSSPFVQTCAARPAVRRRNTTSSCGPASAREACADRLACAAAIGPSRRQRPVPAPRHALQTACPPRGEAGLRSGSFAGQSAPRASRDDARCRRGIGLWLAAARNRGLAARVRRHGGDDAVKLPLSQRVRGPPARLDECRNVREHDLALHATSRCARRS